MRSINAALSGESCQNLAVSTIRRVLHPTDLKATSTQALRMAIAVAEQNGADLVLMHALPPPTPLYEIDSPYRNEAEQALATLARHLSNLGVTAKRVLVKGNTPVPRSIARCATFFKADLIVMGTGSRTGIARFLAGSMSASVIRAAPCPVLVVKGCSANWLSAARAAG